MSYGLDPLRLTPDANGKLKDWMGLYPFGVDSFYYGSIQTALGAIPNTQCVGVDYDWRFDLLTVADAAAAKMDKSFQFWSNRSTVDAVDVVGHSMGGLVARLAYGRVSQQLRDLWARTYTLGTPHGGSYEAARSLNDIIDGLKMLTGWDIARSYLPWLNAAARTDLESLVRSFPSFYSLLPRGSGSEWADIDPNADLLLRPDLYYHPSPELSRLLPGAAADWGALGPVAPAGDPCSSACAGPAWTRSTR